MDAGFTDAAMLAFHYEATDAEREHARLVDEPGRALVWDDDGRIVATASVYSRDMSVPGRDRAVRRGDRRHRRAEPPAARAADRADAPPARRPARRGRGGRRAEGVGGRDLRALRLRAGRPTRPCCAPAAPTGACWQGAGRTTVPRCASRSRPRRSTSCGRCTRPSARAGRGCSTARGPGGTTACSTSRTSATARPRAARCWPTAATRCTRSRAATTPVGRRARSASASCVAATPRGARAAVVVPARPGPHRHARLAQRAGRRAADADAGQPARAPTWRPARRSGCASSTCRAR